LASTALFIFLFLPKEKGRLRYLSVVMACCFLTSAWFFIRNHMLYQDWTGYVAYTQRLAAVLHQAPAFIIEHDIFSFLSHAQYNGQAVGYLFHFCFSSFWGVFSWMSLPLPNIFYIIAYGLVVLSAIGFGMSFCRPGKAIIEPKMLLVLVATLFFQVVAIIFYVMMIKYQPQGRYLYPVIAVLGFLFCSGLLALFKTQAARRMFMIGFCVFMVGMNAFSFAYCQAMHYFLAFK
jgi:hypothetical protein